MLVMRKLWLILPVLLAALIVGAALHSPAVNAEDVVARALDASTSGATVQVGNYTWIEEAGIGLQLPPAPPSKDFPRMLAGKTYDGTRSAALWELGPQGFSALKTRLEKEGVSFSGSEPSVWRPRQYPTDLSIQTTNLTFSDARRGVMMDWGVSGRHFAVVVVDSSFDAADRKLSEVVRELVLLEDVEKDGIAPLLFQGRYACVLNGWQRDGERLRRREEQGWLSLRVFQIAATDFESVGRLQFELESKLKDAGFDRSAGLKPTIVNNEGFVGEYFGKDGFVQRIAYAKLEGGYMVALMQAPEALRSTLTAEMDKFARTLQASGLNGATGPAPLYFHQVSRIRVHAWQDGGKVMWGVLFDDSRQQPVLWRQDAVAWKVVMQRGTETIREDFGEANSSRALNPLVDSDLRALPLPENFTGDVDITVTVGGLSAKTRLTLK